MEGHLLVDPFIHAENHLAADQKFNREAPGKLRLRRSRSLSGLLELVDNSLTQVERPLKEVPALAYLERLKGRGHTSV
jgi:hypothetical protein